MDNNQKNQQRGPQNDDMNKKDKMPGGQGQGGQNKCQADKVEAKADITKNKSGDEQYKKERIFSPFYYY